MKCIGVKAKMKVLHLLQSNRFSGAENVVCQIISMLRDQIDFVYCSQDGQIREALKERNVIFHPVKKWSAIDIGKVIKDEQPDLIHAHDMNASFMASLTCGRIPLVSHIHNNNFDSRGLSTKSLLYYYAAKKAKHIFWVSDSSYNGYRFHNSLRSKSSVLYNIIDIDELNRKMSLDQRQYEFEVVFLGRLTPQKNPQRLIDVFEQIAQKRPKTKMAIVGTGELDEEMKIMVEKRRLGKNISFLGFQNNPYKILHDAKVMIMTSRWEGTPMCALEAMALGVPIVSTPTDGLKDLVKDGVTGFLSEKDEKLAESIVNILDNFNLYQELSTNSTNLANEMMNMENYKRCILDAYLSD